jgi:hypothetical protein
MKPANKRAAFILFIALAIVAGWWLSRPSQVSAPVAEAKVIPPNASVSQPLTKSADLPKIVQPYARTPMLNLADPRWKDYEIKRKMDPSWEWKVPIEFFGKILDDKNQPVANAEIKYSWSGTAEKYGGDGVEHRTLKSDSRGEFVINGIEGKGMTVYVSKEGYYKRRSWNDGRFEYAGFWEPTFIEPDRNNPVIFRLVKRPSAEPTYRIGSRIFLEPPGLETQLDLLSPNVQSTTPADLSVRFIRPPGASYEKPFAWSVTIEGRNGAEIVETTDEFMLQAPTDGYKSKLVREYKESRGNSRQKVRFYVRSKGRKLYAAVDFEMAAYRRMNGSEPASIIITATVNPNDSPNVEYDPAKNIREIGKK